MSPLERHLNRVVDVLKGAQKPDVLNDLLVSGAEAGPRGLVYRNSSLLAATDALRSNYQATAAIMGADFFSGMARAYIEANRPSERSLVGYGQSLPSFISTAAAEHGLPWLADMARLDRAWLDAHLAGDTTPLDADIMAELAHDEEALFASHFELGASVRIIRTEWQIFDLWADLRAGNVPHEATDIARAPEHVQIARPGGDVVFRRISKGEFALLRALKSGASLGGAAEIALGQAPDFDIADGLAQIIQGGLFAAPDTKG